MYTHMRAPHIKATPRGNRRQAGFTLLSILVSILVFAVGMLGLASVYSRLVASATQDQNLTQLVGLSNSFMGMVQAKPSLLTSTSFVGTYYTGSTPPSGADAYFLQWLNTATASLPPGTRITIATAKDAAGANSACDPNTGCTITLTISWTQTTTSSNTITNGPATRTQVFTYQYPLS